MKKRTFAGAVMIIAGILLILYKLAGYRLSQKEYERLKEEFITGEVEQEEDLEQLFSVNVDELTDENPDFVGWLHIEGVLDYPIVKSEDNEEYLHTSFEGKYSQSGCLFTDLMNGPNWNDTNTVIYGHNMNDGSMFGILKKYMDQEFYEGHEWIQIFTTDYRVLTYEVVSVQVVDKRACNYQILFTKHTMWKFLQTIQTGALYDTYLLYMIDEQDRFLTLSTCNTTDRKNKRLVVHAVLIDEEICEL